MQPPLIVSHPLAQVHLTAMRAAATPSAEFRWHLQRLAEILFVEAARNLDTESVPIRTPLAATRGTRLVRPIVLAPILRAGLGLQQAIHPLVPEAAVAYVGIRRDEATAQPLPYYANLPAGLEAADVFVLDPMLATGGTSCLAVQQLKQAGACRLHFVCVVATPAGLASLQQAHPEVRVVTAAVDEGLNDQSYIVPGLGDAGDRLFGT